MIQWRFYLDGVEIEEPQGFSALGLSLDRHPTEHGISVEASVESLGFYGAAFDILLAAKNSQGVDANVVFSAEQKCEGEADWTEVISGKLNFGSYRESCGNICIIRMTLENKGCYMTFKNRQDQKVDIESIVAFDKATQLADYDGIGFNMQLATQEIPISADAEVETADTLELEEPGMVTGSTVLIRPFYSKVIDNSILRGQLDNPANTFENVIKTFLLSPQVLIEENASCINEDYVYDIRMKGRMSVMWDIAAGDPDLGISLVVDYWDGNGDHFTNRIVIGTTAIVNDAVENTVYEYDQTYAGSLSIPAGVGVYAYIELHMTTGTALTGVTINNTFDPETSFLLENTKACPPTDCEVNLIYESFARVTEAITDRCLTVVSNYFGRTDSQPYSYAADGCGALRVLTNGLKIRQADEKKMFVSMKDLLDSVRGDNIGLALEGNNIRIENVRYFYQSDVKIMDIVLVPESVTDIDESLVYSTIKVGYNKWESKSIKGIDEFNSVKEFRTGIKSVNNPIDLTSNAIYSGYIIENLRTTTLVNTGNTDTTYDNDLFGIWVERGGYGYQVEQGIAENASGFFSPSTAYNWRARPMYNLMRWFKSIAQAYTSIYNTASKLFFTEGKGNYLASGNISVYDACGLDAAPVAENNDLDYTDFKNISDATPIYRPEIITFEYSLSVTQYQAIKSAPYGYINVSCGTNGLPIKTFIKSIEFKPATGMANFTLIKAWQ